MPDQVTIIIMCITFQSLLLLFSNKTLIIRAGIHKMPVRIANRENPDQSGVCLSKLFWQAISV